LRHVTATLRTGQAATHASLQPEFGVLNFFFHSERILYNRPIGSLTTPARVPAGTARDVKVQVAGAAGVDRYGRAETLHGGCRPGAGRGGCGCGGWQSECGAVGLRGQRRTSPATRWRWRGSRCAGGTGGGSPCLGVGTDTHASCTHWRPIPGPDAAAWAMAGGAGAGGDGAGRGRSTGALLTLRPPRPRRCGARAQSR
jgi:hypothetical protein